MEEDEETSNDFTNHYGSIIMQDKINSIVNELADAVKETAEYENYHIQIDKMKKNPE